MEVCDRSLNFFFLSVFYSSADEIFSNQLCVFVTQKEGKHPVTTANILGVCGCVICNLCLK